MLLLEDTAKLFHVLLLSPAPCIHGQVKQGIVVLWRLNTYYYIIIQSDSVINVVE
jgi:hypothetical protein